nr:3-dehydroquinate synthase [Saprospiraceae bacterium]
MPQTFGLHDYSVHLGDLRETFPSWLRGRDYSQVWILTDENTRRHCLPLFAEKTGLPADSGIIEIPAGEQYKNLSTCERVWQSMLDARLDRRALLVNLGGGVIGDLGGFCAATWKRGIDFVQAPTTLLSMTDAAIGGKLGIDFQSIKNTIGVFKNPGAVFVDPVFLQTLPERELRSGFAEVIKHALIGDPVLWRRIQSDGVTSSHPVTEMVQSEAVTSSHPVTEMAQSEAVTSSHRLTTNKWFDVLQASISVKVRVVQEDPFEKGLRAILNFGHTIGHALESYYLETPEPLTHG